MKYERQELVRGSGNAFLDLGHKNADVEQFKAILAAEIIKVLDREGLSVHAAHGCTGLRRPTSRVSAMRTSAGLLSIASCRSSIGSGRG